MSGEPDFSTVVKNFSGYTGMNVELSPRLGRAVFTIYTPGPIYCKIAFSDLERLNEMLTNHIRSVKEQIEKERAEWEAEQNNSSERV